VDRILAAQWGGNGDRTKHITTPFKPVHDGDVLPPPVIDTFAAGAQQAVGTPAAVAAL
jgi:hypothetical protein